MNAFDRCIRCLRIARSWYGKKFEVLARMHAESDTFKKEWSLASNNESLGLAKQFAHKMRVKAQHRTGMRLISYFWFIRVQEWQRDFNHSPKELGWKTRIIKCEGGTSSMEGVAIPITPGEPFTKFRVLEMYDDNVQFLEEEGHFEPRRSAAGQRATRDLQSS